MPDRFVLHGASDVERIDWTVHLANKKAVWFEFDTIRGVTGDVTEGAPYPATWPLRNQAFIPANQPEERARRLIIDPGPRTLMGPGQRIEIEKGNSDATASGGRAPSSTAARSRRSERWRRTTRVGSSWPGGFGVSGAVEPDAVPSDGRLPSFVNNDKWFDDVSDGSVTARIVFRSGAEEQAAGAWLIVGPPDYAPPITHLVTMYDVLFDVAVRSLGARPDLFDVAAGQFTPDFLPSYTNDVYPILRRAFDYRWVIKQATSHSAGVFDFAALGEPRRIRARIRRTILASKSSIVFAIRRTSTVHRTVACRGCTTTAPEARSRKRFD